jgi:hypothetical protein
MKSKTINRKEFIQTLGRFGAGTCLCAAAAGMHAAFGQETTKPKSAETPPPPVEQTKPGEKTVARAAKRMEFGDTWLPRFFKTMDQTVDETSRRKLMIANGKACFDGYAGPPKKQPSPDAVEKFKAWIKEKGKARGYSIEGDVISFEFISSAETGQASPASLCLCPMAEAQTPKTLSPTYCLCSVGYVKEMHERILGKPINVELVDSVLRGGPRCKFKITIG